MGGKKKELRKKRKKELHVAMEADEVVVFYF